MIGARSGLLFRRTPPEAASSKGEPHGHSPQSRRAHRHSRQRRRPLDRILSQGAGAQGHRQMGSAGHRPADLLHAHRRQASRRGAVRAVGGRARRPAWRSPIPPCAARRRVSITSRSRSIRARIGCSRSTTSGRAASRSSAGPMCTARRAAKRIRRRQRQPRVLLPRSGRQPSGGLLLDDEGDTAEPRRAAAGRVAHVPAKWTPVRRQEHAPMK